MLGPEEARPLVEAARRASPRSAGDLVAALRAREPIPFPLHPWARWLLVALHRQVRRQAWVGKIVTERLGGDLERIGREGARGHPEGRPSRGIVPGLPEWEYLFHGEGCCLTHDDGTTIDVDFFEGRADHIDWFFYGRYLETVASPEPIEARLKKEEPIADHWLAPASELGEAGLLAAGLTPSALGRRWAAVLEPLLLDAARAPDACERAWCAIVADDAPYAVELLGAEAPEQLRLAARAQVATRATHLTIGLTERPVVPRLHAIAALGHPFAAPTLRALLARRPVDAHVSTALRILHLFRHPDDLPSVRPVLDAATGDRGAEVYARVEAAHLVMALVGPQGDPSALASAKRALERPAGPLDGQSAFLLALLDPELGLSRLRAACGSSIKAAREGAAFGLALLGTERALRELRAVETYEATHVLALLRGHALEPGPAPEAEVGVVDGEPVRLYALNELIDAHDGPWLSMDFQRFLQKHAPIARQWLAH